MKQIKLGLVDNNRLDRQLYNDYFKSRASLDCLIAVKNVEYLNNHQEILNSLDYLLIAYDENVFSEDLFFENILKTKELKQNLSVVIFSDYMSIDFVQQCFSFGADGFLLKSTPKNGIESIFINAFPKGAILSPIIAKQLIKKTATVTLSKSLDDKRFSVKQLKIIKYLMQGEEYQKIAEKLDISIYGVQYHIKQIYTKLQVSSKTELLNKFYLQNGTLNVNPTPITRLGSF